MLIYNFIKKISFNYFLILIIFSPIFLLYPLAELEVLGRKEIFIFIGFIIFLTLNSNKAEDKKDISPKPDSTHEDDDATSRIGRSGDILKRNKI